MTTLRTRLHDRCVAALRDYLGDGGEAALHAAYELGRDAYGQGLGVLDMTSIVQGGLRELAAESDEASLRLLLEAAEAFLFECYSPFEMAHRGARESNEALQRIGEAREQEMRRLAVELHDHAGQMLAAVHLALGGVEPHLAPEGVRPLGAVRDHLREVEQQMRRISHEMRPALLDDLGLVPALRFLAEGVSRRAALPIEVEDRLGKRLPAPVETAMYRAAQEGLTNFVRHARATRAVICLERDAGCARLRVRDDGIGFDAGAIAAGDASRGLGLRAIRERLAPLGGSLEIRSARGKGTELVIAVPAGSLEHAAHSAR